MRALILALVLLASCGGSHVDPAFAGNWNGTAFVTLSGGSAYSYPASLRVSVDGDTAHVSNVCPSGAGTISASGSGSSLTWLGSLTCPPLSFSDCASVVFTFTAGTMTLDRGALVAQGTASGSGCGVTRAATFSFTGSR